MTPQINGLEYETRWTAEVRAADVPDAEFQEVAVYEGSPRTYAGDDAATAEVQLLGAEQVLQAQSRGEALTERVQVELDAVLGIVGAPLCSRPCPSCLSDLEGAQEHLDEAINLLAAAQLAR